MRNSRHEQKLNTNSPFLATRAPPSPRVRGEGRGEGASPLGSESRRRPLTRRAGARRPLPAQRGEVKSKSVLATRLRPSFATKGTTLLPPNKGRRSAERRIQPVAAPQRLMLPWTDASGAAAALRGRSPLGAPTAALAKATERSSSAQAVLRVNERTRALPAPSVALKRSTPRAGRHAGGNDARTARERGYKPRPQEPHSLHQSAVTGRRP